MHSTPSPTDSSNCFCSSSTVGLTDCPHATVQCWSDWAIPVLVWLNSSTVGLTGQFHCWSDWTAPLLVRWTGHKTPTYLLTPLLVSLTVPVPVQFHCWSDWTVPLLVWLNSSTVGLTGQFHCWSDWTVPLFVWLNSSTVGLTGWQGAIKPVVTLDVFCTQACKSLFVKHGF